MPAVLARLARLLDLDRPTPGERTTWTVRTAHAVHAVELEQAVTGTRVRLDDVVVGRSPAWTFSDEPFRFAIGGTAAILAIRPETGTGTVRASLLVGGEPVPQDVPAWRRRQVQAIRWRGLLARFGYVLGALLVAAAAVGDPFLDWVSTALATAVHVAWIAAVRGVDPFALLPAWAHAVTASRAGMLVAGIELLGLVAVARDGRLRARVPVLRSPSRVSRVAGWSLLVLAAAILPTLLDS